MQYISRVGISTLRVYWVMHISLAFSIAWLQRNWCVRLVEVAHGARQVERRSAASQRSEWRLYFPKAWDLFALGSESILPSWTEY